MINRFICVLFHTKSFGQSDLCLMGLYVDQNAFINPNKTLNNYCKACHPACLTCFDYGDTKCRSCSLGYMQYPD